jgi:hypothetical protein
MTIFYCLRFETPSTWWARSLYLYPPETRWSSFTPRALGSLFFASYDSQGYDGCIRTRLHAVWAELPREATAPTSLALRLWAVSSFLGRSPAPPQCLEARFSIPDIRSESALHGLQSDDLSEGLINITLLPRRSCFLCLGSLRRCCIPAPSVASSRPLVNYDCALYVAKERYDGSTVCGALRPHAGSQTGPLAP